MALLTLGSDDIPVEDLVGKRKEVEEQLAALSSYFKTEIDTLGKKAFAATPSKRGHHGDSDDEDKDRAKRRRVSPSSTSTSTSTPPSSTPTSTSTLSSPPTDLEPNPAPPTPTPTPVTSAPAPATLQVHETVKGCWLISKIITKDFENRTKTFSVQRMITLTNTHVRISRQVKSDGKGAAFRKLDFEVERKCLSRMGYQKSGGVIQFTNFEKDCTFKL